MEDYNFIRFRGPVRVGLGRDGMLRREVSGGLSSNGFRNAARGRGPTLLSIYPLVRSFTQGENAGALDASFVSVRSPTDEFGDADRLPLVSLNKSMGRRWVASSFPCRFRNDETPVSLQKDGKPFDCFG
ncbi:hypothetical protein ACFX13_024457 [Malus domestica]